MPASSWEYAVVNLITASRIVSAAFVVMFTANGNWRFATPLLLLGFASDLIDGYLARKWGATSERGRRLDAQADRLLLVSPVIGMTIAGELHAAIAVLLVTGVWIADFTAEKFGVMRLLWWPLLYGAVAWGVWNHSSQSARVAALAVAALAFAVVLIVKRDEVKKVLSDKTSTA